VYQLDNNFRYDNKKLAEVIELFRRKGLVPIVGIMLTISLFMWSCAPAAAPAEPKPVTPAPATPSEQPKNSSQPQTQTPNLPPPPPPITTTPGAQEIRTSFEAITYTSDKYGFSLKYPKNWVKKEATGDVVLSIASSQDQTADSVNVSVISEVNDIAAAAKNAIDNSDAFKQFNVKSKIESQKNVMLADGKTTAQEVILSAKIVIYDVYLYCVGVNAGGKTILVIGNTVESSSKNKELLQEIAKTLTIK
jgi:type IV secretory pathway VirB10-like protein